MSTDVSEVRAASIIRATIALKMEASYATYFVSRVITAGLFYPV
jgi:hypothetical protein